MTGPAVSGPVVANPLTWQLEAAVAPDGTRVLRVTFNQGNLATQLVLGLDDARTLAAQVDQAATQARTGLILPNHGHLPPPPGTAP